MYTTLERVCRIRNANIVKEESRGNKEAHALRCCWATGEESIYVRWSCSPTQARFFYPCTNKSMRMPTCLVVPGDMEVDLPSVLWPLDVSKCILGRRPGIVLTVLQEQYQIAHLSGNLGM